MRTYVESRDPMTTPPMFHGWFDTALQDSLPLEQPKQQPQQNITLGKRPKPADEPRKKELVFKGFSLEPQSKKIKFVNTDRKTEGINGKIFLTL
jgi:hypothetical protein